MTLVDFDYSVWALLGMMVMEFTTTFNNNSLIYIYMYIMAVSSIGGGNGVPGESNQPVLGPFVVFLLPRGCKVWQGR